MALLGVVGNFMRWDPDERGKSLRESGSLEIDYPWSLPDGDLCFPSSHIPRCHEALPEHMGQRNRGLDPLKQ